MNTQSERAISRRHNRVFGFIFLRKLASWIELKRQAYRAREAREALRAMSPELLDDIGLAIDVTGEPAIKFESQHPHLIAIEALGRSTRYHDPS
ncbi:MAG: DUF1127 domain-containing protein [Parvibaculaceae bacterium]